MNFASIALNLIWPPGQLPHSQAGSEERMIGLLWLEEERIAIPLASYSTGAGRKSGEVGQETVGLEKREEERGHMGRKVSEAYAG